MPGKLNCWEYKKCGREKNGAKTNEFGVCPVCDATKLNGIHSGKNGGELVGLLLDHSVAELFKVHL